MENEDGRWALINFAIIIVAYILISFTVWLSLRKDLFKMQFLQVDGNQENQNTNSLTKTFRKYFLVYFFENQLELNRIITIEKVNTFFLIITNQEAIQSIFLTQKSDAQNDLEMVWTCAIFPFIGLGITILQKLYYSIIFICYEKYCYDKLIKIKPQIDQFSSYDPRPKIYFVLGFIVTNLIVTTVAFALDTTNQYFTDLLKYAAISSGIHIGIEIFIAGMAAYFFNPVKRQTQSQISMADTQQQQSPA